jgi:hypothetical protein
LNVTAARTTALPARQEKETSATAIMKKEERGRKGEAGAAIYTLLRPLSQSSSG